MIHLQKKNQMVFSNIFEISRVWRSLSGEVHWVKCTKFSTAKPFSLERTNCLIAWASCPNVFVAPAKILFSELKNLPYPNKDFTDSTECVAHNVASQMCDGKISLLRSHHRRNCPFCTNVQKKESETHEVVCAGNPPNKPRRRTC